jgi:hypothetical protein
MIEGSTIPPQRKFSASGANTSTLESHARARIGSSRSVVPEHPQRRARLRAKEKGVRGPTWGPNRAYNETCPTRAGEINR